MAFAVLGFGPLFHAWNCHSPHLSIFSQRPLLRPPLVVACLLSGVIQLAFIALPALRRIIHAYPLSLRDWLVAGLLSAAVIPAVELSKAVMRLWLRTHPAKPQPR
jgi:Ca2+-transporting ATPase